MASQIIRATVVTFLVGQEIPWEEYLKNHVEEKQHEIMRRNVLLATRNFQNRMEAFRKEIIFGRNNPMCVRHISYRVEFQGD